NGQNSNWNVITANTFNGGNAGFNGCSANQYNYVTCTGVNSSGGISGFGIQNRATGDYSGFQIADGAGGIWGQMYIQPSGGYTFNIIATLLGQAIGIAADRVNMTLNLFLGTNGAGYQTTGPDWYNPSDVRTKNVIGDYMQGLDDILKLQPKIFTFKGNDTLTNDLNKRMGIFENNDQKQKRDTVPYYGSWHYTEAVTEKICFGFIAQELEEVFPEAVTRQDAFIDGLSVNDYRIVNEANIKYALVNAIKELKTMNDDLLARIEALESQTRH
ncbi:MAG TPA: tail fiber domain-containing protein, partial [Bacteroidia bacterium]|nr:tail fiber domain-containing protein [Bacteroidia bacterium]